MLDDLRREHAAERTIAERREVRERIADVHVRPRARDASTIA